MSDDVQLQRFIHAQEEVYDDVISELKQGRKQTHWMWFVFPQLAGLGQSDTAVYYSLASEAEAQAYLHHALLGSRLIECAEIILQLDNKTAEDIFGPLDAMKLRSSMTLFERVKKHSVFTSVLERYFQGQPDMKTLALLE